MVLIPFRQGEKAQIFLTDDAFWKIMISKLRLTDMPVNGKGRV